MAKDVGVVGKPAAELLGINLLMLLLEFAILFCMDLKTQQKITCGTSAWCLLFLDMLVCMNLTAVMAENICVYSI
jgi:hypothetical protein